MKLDDVQLISSVGGLILTACENYPQRSCRPCDWIDYSIEIIIQDIIQPALFYIAMICKPGINLTPAAVVEYYKDFYTACKSQEFNPGY